MTIFMMKASYDILGECQIYNFAEAGKKFFSFVSEKKGISKVFHIKNITSKKVCLIQLYVEVNS